MCPEPAQAGRSRLQVALPYTLRLIPYTRRTRGAPVALLRAERRAQVGGDLLAAPQHRVRRAVGGCSIAAHRVPSRVPLKAGPLVRFGQINHALLRRSCTPSGDMRITSSARLCSDDDLTALQAKLALL